MAAEHGHAASAAGEGSVLCVKKHGVCGYENVEETDSAPALSLPTGSCKDGCSPYARITARDHRVAINASIVSPNHEIGVHKHVRGFFLPLMFRSSPSPMPSCCFCKDNGIHGISSLCVQYQRIPPLCCPPITRKGRKQLPDGQMRLRTWTQKSEIALWRLCVMGTRVSLKTHGGAGGN